MASSKLAELCCPRTITPVTQRLRPEFANNLERVEPGIRRFRSMLAREKAPRDRAATLRLTRQRPESAREGPREQTQRRHRGPCWRAKAPSWWLAPEWALTGNDAMTPDFNRSVRNRKRNTLRQFGFPGVTASSRTTGRSAGPGPAISKLAPVYKRSRPSTFRRLPAPSHPSKPPPGPLAMYTFLSSDPKCVDFTRAVSTAICVTLWCVNNGPTRATPETVYTRSQTPGGGTGLCAPRRNARRSPQDAPGRVDGASRGETIPTARWTPIKTSVRVTLPQASRRAPPGTAPSKRTLPY